MGIIQSPPPAKMISAILYSESLPLRPIMEKLTSLFGRIDYRSSDYEFSFTDYYHQRMKPPLKKFFLSFEALFAREKLPQWKRKTNAIEEEFTIKEKGHILRLVNIDPGYVTDSKLILATTKDFSHRIYLCEGIYAEVTLNFQKGTFRPHPWTYPDYRMTEAISFFNEVRKIYMKQLKSDL